MNSSGDIGLLPSVGGVPSTSSFPSSQQAINTKTMIINPSATTDTQVVGEGSNVKWTKINDVTTSQSIQPRPRHGHRAVAYGNYMIVFGGGNEGIVEELHVFDTTNHEWFQPQMKGDVPPGCAAYGLVLDGCRMLLYGGMIEYGRYSSDLFELNIPKWEWKKLKPKGPRNGEPPCARLGHSFTIIRDQVFLFGGLANDSDDLKNNIPRYLNDMFTLQVRLNNENGIWDVPVTFGSPPGPRESHTAVAYVSKDLRFNKLIVYGGMSGCRLGDLYVLDVDTLMWCKPEVGGATPSPRSLHTATLVADKMYVFGGWVPMLVEELKNSEKEWKCTNSLACLNVETLTWENLHQDILDEKVPRARAGHSAVVINTRIYVWSGRDGYRKAWNNQVCCKDLWQLEVQRPGDPGKVQLLRAGTNWLEVGWNPVAGADSYILQCVAYDVPSDPIFQPEPSPAQPPPQSVAAVGFTNPTTPIMTPVPTSKPAKSAVPPAKEVVPPPPVAAAPAAPPTPSITIPTQITSGLGVQPVPQSPQQQPPPVTIPSPVSLPHSQPTLLPPAVVSQPPQVLPSNTIPVSVSVQQQQQPAEMPPTLSMPSLSIPTTTLVAADASVAAVSVASPSISPAVLPTASSLYTLPANVAGTASALLASKSVPRPIVAPVSVAQSAGRGVLRLRTPVQVAQPRTPTTITSLPSGATVLKSPSPSTAVLANNDASSAQLSGMHTLAAAAAATQKIQTQQNQTLKVVQQSPGQPQMFSQVKMANMGTVLPPGIRLGSPVTTTAKQVIPTSTVQTAGGNVKQIIVQKPGAPGTSNQIYTVVKTSQGMALANFQGSTAKVIQGKPGVTTTNIVPASSIQGSPQKAANIIKWVAAPGSGVTTVSKPNIIATNQSLLGLAGQGSPAGTAPRPTYIISKPATTIASRPQTPQYVVVTQASALRSIQGMTTNSLAGGQTITLPTSAATGTSPHGVKMIVMPSSSGGGAPGQAVKIITPSGMQTGTAPKTVTLATSKPAQYITSSGQIVTLPPGLLQPGSQQQISIGGKQVTLQMAGGQKLAILSNSSGQLLQGQGPGDQKPKFVMVGTGQKTTIPASNPMRCTVSVGGIMPQEVPAAMADGVGAAAEGLVEMAAGQDPHLQLAQQDQNLNGMKPDGEGGLKGGSGVSGPWTTFNFEGLPWMKLKGGCGITDHSDYCLRPRGSTIPIYTLSTKFSWRNSRQFGLKGGNPEDEGNAEDAGQSTVSPEQQAPQEEPEQLPEEVQPQQPEEQSSSTSEAQAAVAKIIPDGSTPIEPAAESQPTAVEDVNSEPKLDKCADTPKEDVSANLEPQETNVEPDKPSEEAQETPMDVDADCVPAASGEIMEQPVPPTVAPAVPDPAPTPETQPAAIDAKGGAAPSSAVEPMDVSDNPSLPISIPTEPVQPSPAPPPPATFPAPAVAPESAPVAQQIVSQVQVSQPAAPSVELPAQQPHITQPPTAPSLVAVVQQPPPVPQQPVVTQPTIVGAPSITLTPNFVPVVSSPSIPGQSPPSLVVSLPSRVIGTQPSVMTQPSAPLGVSMANNPGILPPPHIPVTMAASGHAPAQTPTSQVSTGAGPVLPQTHPQQPPPVVTRVAAPSPAPVVRTQVLETARVAGNAAPVTQAPPAAAPSVPPAATNGAVGTQGVTMQVRSAPPGPEEKVDNWMDVVHTKNTSCMVKCYFTTNEKLSRLEPDTPVDKDLEFIKKRVELKPATAYKFRVAAINSCGRGPWGEITAFKTCLPGFPGAPSSIKISKSVDGATIAWEPPLNTPGDILEYSVYLAVKPPPNAPEPKPGVTNLSFVRVYCGPSNSCNVPTGSLNQALVDTTSKPAIIFRIAAKNDKGYGPATQVRWLQESAAPNFASPKTAILKRASPFTPSASGTKRGRVDGN